MVLDTNNSSVFRLNYKLILKIKDISLINTDEFVSKVSEMFEDISERYGVTKEDIKLKDDILIIGFSAKPNTEISKFINAYKSATSRKVKKIFNIDKGIKDFWCKGYLLLTVGDYHESLIELYML